MADKGWVQFLLVAVPVMSLVGAWLALRTVGGRSHRRPAQEEDDGPPGGGHWRREGGEGEGVRKAGGQCRLDGNATGAGLGRLIRRDEVDDE
ncbi:hypothetical protein [Thauera aromatica]|uniref:Uncharacterized protein n=1 Tax=Thauera aromatica K172 TaxID=44139 RepID=A0A2R4BQ66_THAAR|nr:hypothetical protein [Thauera aromatica]AVR89485.1 hypothetical protein Tharo_2590 [Thauera aromatica K172]MCK2095252.1 hypothetical protein [Thauera aromatica]